MSGFLILIIIILTGLLVGWWYVLVGLAVLLVVFVGLCVAFRLMVEYASWWAARHKKSEGGWLEDE